MEKILTQDALNHLIEMGDWMGEKVNKVFTNDELPSVVNRVSSRNIHFSWLMSFACRMTGLGSIKAAVEAVQKGESNTEVRNTITQSQISKYHVPYF